MDIPNGVILDPPNLSRGAMCRCVPIFSEPADCRRRFQNDANAAAFGEFWAGPASMSIAWSCSLSAGVGGGIIIGDTIVQESTARGRDRAHEDRAFQPAPVRLRTLGCLEAYASATAVVKRGLEALAQPGVRSQLLLYLNKEGGLTARDNFESIGSRRSACR